MKSIWSADFTVKQHHIIIQSKHSNVQRVHSFAVGVVVIFESLFNIHSFAALHIVSYGIST